MDNIKKRSLEELEGLYQDKLKHWQDRRPGGSSSTTGCWCWQARRSWIRSFSTAVLELRVEPSPLLMELRRKSDDRVRQNGSVVACQLSSRRSCQQYEHGTELVSSRLMRRIVIDYARRRSRAKRGGGQRCVTLDDAPEMNRENVTGWLDLDAALNELARIDARAARIVELRFFAGMTVDEVARLLSLGVATIARDWRFARSWLRHRMERRGETTETAPSN